MLLAIDVGNTQTVLGVYENKKLRFRWRVATNKLHTCDELRVKLIPLLSSEGVSFDDISGVALASVVGARYLAIGTGDTELYVFAGMLAAVVISIRVFLFRGAGKAN